MALIRSWQRSLPGVAPEFSLLFHDLWHVQSIPRDTHWPCSPMCVRQHPWHIYIMYVTWPLLRNLDLL